MSVGVPSSVSGGGFFVGGREKNCWRQTARADKVKRNRDNAPIAAAIFEGKLDATTDTDCVNYAAVQL